MKNLMQLEIRQYSNTEDDDDEIYDNDDDIIVGCNEVMMTSFNTNEISVITVAALLLSQCVHVNRAYTGSLHTCVSNPIA